MNSVFKKTFTIYILILMISFLALLVIMSTTIESYFIQQKEKELITQCKQIQEQYTLVTEKGPRYLDDLKKEMEALGRYMGARLWWVNSEGEIYVDSNSDTSFIGKVLTRKEIEDVFKGYIIKKRNEFDEYFEESVLTIGYPIINENKVVIALFIHIPLPGLQENVKAIHKMTINALTFSIFIGFIAIYLLSANVKRDLENLNDAVKYIAKGNFSKRLVVNRNDELGQLATNFNYMADELNKQDEFRKTFISNLSHDLRSPLTSIKGFINAVLDGTVPKDKQEKYLRIALNESERLTKIANNILDLSKMESGTIELNREEFDMNSLIINEIDKFERRLMDKEIHVELDIYKGDVTVSADRDMITRVLNNLIDNAIKFVNNNGEIRITTNIIKNKAYISVANTGRLIPDEELRYIWHRFHKVDKSRGENKHGMGLGLSIIKAIIDYHDEEINVISTPKTGTKFTFTLSKIAKK